MNALSTSGYLSENSLAKIFCFIHEKSKTGVLLLKLGSENNVYSPTTYYLGFQSGAIVYVYSDDFTLRKLIERRGWLPPNIIANLDLELKSFSQPLGIYLKAENILDSYRLKLLFDMQVVVKVSHFFESRQGVYNFQEQPLLAYKEMTGLNMPANEIAALGLARIKDWSGLSDKLPAPEFSLQRLSDRLTLKLENRQQQVWELSQGNLSLIEISQISYIHLEKVRQIAFCLINLGLVYVAIVENKATEPPVDRGRENLDNMDTIKPATLSNSFLGSLMNFLKKKDR
jgi:hypothetical protein